MFGNRPIESTQNRMKDQISFIQTNNTQKFHNEEIRDKIVFQIHIGNNQGTTTTGAPTNNEAAVVASSNTPPSTTTIVQINEEQASK